MTELAHWIIHAGDFNTIYMNKAEIALTELDTGKSRQGVFLWITCKESISNIVYENSY